MANLKPFLLSDDAKGQAEFYVKALGGEILSILTYGQAMGLQDERKEKVVHLCVAVAEGQAIFMKDSFEPVSHGSGLLLNLSYPKEGEARIAFGNLASGGEAKVPFERQPYGLFYGEVTDKYGVSWMVTADRADEDRN